jgi:NAD(P)-dependent dehydrogenase (short-subunit alcohol dehydrogenase family)
MKRNRGYRRRSNDINTSVVLITSALTGIERATALAFASGGAQVASGRRPELGHPFAKELRSLGAEAEFLQADVGMEDEVRRLIDQIFELFGRLDVAVNNAGTEGSLGAITEQTVDDYRAVFDSNVLGVLLCLKHELRVMLPQKHGGVGASLYSASKHAVEGLSQSAALEAAAAGIRVNAIAPGPIDTDMLSRIAGTVERKRGTSKGVPPQRLGKPEEIAQAILFLSSNKTAFITGQVFGVDGGAMA